MNGPASVSNTWPFKPATLEPSVIKPETIFIPEEDFKFIHLSVTENEYPILEGIELERHLYHNSESINGFS